MKSCTVRVGKWVGILAISLAAIGMLAGCDDSEYDYDPPSGMGALVVDNFTGDRLLVYVDGMKAESAPAGHHRYYDLDPGVHRIALDGDDTHRAWARDVDILEGRRTVLEVHGTSTDYYALDVRIYFD